MSTINFRIEKLVKHFSNGNNSDFGLKIGVNEANIRNYISGTEPKFNILEKIANNLEINFEWLLTGRGSMLKEEKQPVYSQKENIIQINEDAPILNKTNTSCEEVVKENYQLKYENMALMHENSALKERQQEQIQSLTAQIEILTKDKEERISELKERIQEYRERISELKEQVSVLKNVSSLDDTHRGVG